MHTSINTPTHPSQAQDNNSAGDYEGARSCGMAALCCNIVAMVYFVLLVLAGVAGVLVYFLYIVPHINDFSPATVCCAYNYYSHCTRYCTI